MFLVAAILLTTALCVTSEIKTSLRFPIPTPNKILGVHTTCNSTTLQISVKMAAPFKGLLTAKDFSQECRSVGLSQNIVKLVIPASGCGVRMAANSSDGRLYYSVTVVAQQDRFLRQITDREEFVRCFLEENALSLKSQPMLNALRSEMKMETTENRKGRMRSNWSEQPDNSTEAEAAGEKLDRDLEDVLAEARAWMEITPTDNQSVDSVQVGQATNLVVKSTLPVGIGWRVVSCTAHDGLSPLTPLNHQEIPQVSSQRLLDEDGCAVDSAILPALAFRPARPLGATRETKGAPGFPAMRHQEAVTGFAAFKFPDRDRLHVRCGLELCRGKCPQVNCQSGDAGYRKSRKLRKGSEGEILDRLEVFNSVEVLAPGIELDDYRGSDAMSDPSKLPPFTARFPGDRSFCVSPDKMALAFCTLGLVFLVAAAVAVWSLLRARRSGVRHPYYSRSLFSSSSSGGSGASGYGGSKMLLNDSPTLGQTRHWRIL